MLVTLLKLATLCSGHVSGEIGWDVVPNRARKLPTGAQARPCILAHRLGVDAVRFGDIISATVIEPGAMS